MNKALSISAFLSILMTIIASGTTVAAGSQVDPSTLTGKVMAGYQGWFRCPGDPSGDGWKHWSTSRESITGETVSFDLWPDTSEYDKDELYPADKMTYPDGSQAYLYSAANPKSVLRHFQWMRQNDIDGVWLQQFLVSLPGGLHPQPSLTLVMNNVMAAAKATGRVWAVSYDIAGTPTDMIFDGLTRDWQSKVDSGITSNARYLHHNGKPVINIWGFYYKSDGNKMTPELANRLIDYFKTSGKYGAFLVGGGSWNWHSVPDPEWQAFYKRFDAYIPWNVGNFSKSPDGVCHASTGYWDDNRTAAQANGTIWIPVVYPGFSWSNIARVRDWAPAQFTYSRNGGKFFWEEWVKLARMSQKTAYIAMFDEVDEGTAIYKVTNTAPVQGHFITYDGYPSDWYLRLAQQGIRMIRGQSPISEQIPIKP